MMFTSPKFLFLTGGSKPLFSYIIVSFMMYTVLGASYDLVSWKSAVSGPWENATLWYHPWSPGAIPFPGSDVLISPQTAASAEITIQNPSRSRTLVFNQRVYLKQTVFTVCKLAPCRADQVFDPVASKCVNSTVQTEVNPPLGPHYGGTSVEIRGKDLGVLGNFETVSVKFMYGNAETYTVPGIRLSIERVSCVAPNANMTGIAEISVLGEAGSVSNATEFLFYSREASLVSVYPPMSLSTGGMQTRITVHDIPESSASFITIRLRDSSGYNITARAVSFANNTVTYITPSYGKVLNDPSIAMILEIAPNGQQYVPGQSLDFKYYILPTIGGIDVPQIQAKHPDTNITIGGSGYFESSFIQCRFGVGRIGFGYFVSLTSIKCSVPQFETARIISVEVSLDDGNNYEPSTSVLIVVDYVSEECRRKEELPTFQPDRQQLGLYYFPNLAIGAHVTTSPRKDSYDTEVGRGLSPSQLFDGDRCCEYNIDTEGYKCGTIFNVNSSMTELASIVVDIGYSAYVDEILTSWFRPCKNLPDPGYTIETRANVSSDWVKLLERSVWKENPCRTLTGDNGPTAFCADFFQPIVAQQFRLTFNNSVDHFLVGAGTDGGWLMEFEVHGIFLKTPYRLNYVGSQLHVKSNVNVPIPPMVVELLSILDGQMNASDPNVARTVSLTLLDASQSDVTSKYLASYREISVQGRFNFSNVGLVRPNAGTYSLVFGSSGLKSTNATIVVTQGTPVSLKMKDGESTTYASADTVALNLIEIEAFDPGSNLCSLDSIIREITVSAFNSSTALLGGELTANMTFGTASFNDIQLLKPPTGLHGLVFESVGLERAVYWVNVGIGVPVEITLDAYDTYPRQSADFVNVPPIAIKIRDAGATVVPTGSLSIDVTLVGTVSALVGNLSVSSHLGHASFSNLRLSAPPTGIYTLRFSTTSLPSSVVYANVTIVPGAAKSIFIHNDTAVSKEYGSAVITRIDPITVGVLDAGGNRVYSSGIIRVSLSPRPDLLSGTTVVDMINGTALVSNVTILSPPSGEFCLNFSMPGLEKTSMPISIVAGYAVSLRIDTGKNQTHESVESLTLDSFSLRAIDAGGTVSPSGKKERETGDPNIIVSCSNCLLDGTTTVSMQSDGSVDFTNVKIKSPKSGDYTLQFTSSNGLQYAQAVVKVTIGPAHRLKCNPPNSVLCDPGCTPDTGTDICCRSSFTTTLPPITLRAVDAGGDYIEWRQTKSIVVEAVFSSNITASWTGNFSRTMYNGTVLFDDLAILSPSVGRYGINFTSIIGLISSSLVLDIEVGEPAHIVVKSDSFQSTYQCVGNTTIDTVNAQLLDAGGTQISSVSGGKSLALKAYRQDNKEAVINTVNSQVDGNTGIATWTKLRTVIPPKIGMIVGEISGFLSNVQAFVHFNFSIVSGPVVEIGVVDPPTYPLKAADVTYLPDLVVVQLDAGGNLADVEMQTQYNLTANLVSDPSMLSGTRFAPMINGRYNASDLALLSPKDGVTYTLQFQSTGIPYTLEQSISIVHGDPAKLGINGGLLPQYLKSDNQKFYDPEVTKFTVVMQDSAGNTVKLSASDNYVIVASCMDCSTAFSLEATMSTSTNEAVFDDIVLQGIRNSTYVLGFALKSNSNIKFDQQVKIQSCQDVRLNSVRGKTDGETCVCDLGHQLVTGKCDPCPSGKYKSQIGDNECILCSLQNAQTKPGATGETDCRCAKGYFYNSTEPIVDYQCKQCDDIEANCPGGQIDTEITARTIDIMGPIYPKPGYWRAPDAIHEWNIIKCDSNSSCLGGLNSSCAAHHENPMCAFCKDGYAQQQGKCIPCIAHEWTILFVIAAAFVALFVARWFINKQMLGGRSPEATIMKIMIAYIQVLGFIGGFKARWLERMSDFYSVVSIGSTLDVFEWQPVDCGVGKPDYYFKYFFWLGLIPLCFILPLILYNISKLSCWKAIVAIRKSPQKSLSVRAKHRLSQYIENRGSTVSSSAPESQSHGRVGEVLSTIMWPMTWFFMVFLSGIPSGISSGWRNIKSKSSPGINKLVNRIMGDHLQSVEEEDDQPNRRRATTAVDDETAAQVRAHAKSTGGVLFEQDPFVGRSSMSLTKGAFWIMFFFFLPTIMKNTMEWSNCITLGGKASYLFKDLRIQCGSIGHEAVRIWGFWASLIPLVCILVLYVFFKNVAVRKRRELVPYLSVYNLCWEDAMGYLRLPPTVDPQVAQMLRKEKTQLRRLRKYLFLFSGYRADGVLYMWDMVIMARKIGIVAILVFARQSPVLQIFCSLLVFVISLVLHLYFKPFDDDYARQKKMPILPSTLEFISLFSTIITLLCGFLFYLKDDQVKDIADFVLFLNILDWVLIVFNLIIVAVFIYLLFRSLINRVSGRVAGLRRRIVESSASQYAARWWKDKFKCCSWGAKEEQSTDVQMDVMSSPSSVDVHSVDSPPQESLPDGWEEKVDEKSGRAYYVHRERRVTQWEKPNSHAREDGTRL